jgi:hypothetical protein
VLTTPIVVAAVSVPAAAIAATGFWTYARAYFFLFDDFALIHIANAESVAHIFSQPLIGFYRPLPFLVLRGEAAMFSWDRPGGYLAVALLLHAVNAALCGLLTRTFKPPRFAPTIAALLFLLSPWATEAFLWLSGLFDVLATLGVLVALIGVRLIVMPHESLHGVVARPADSAGRLRDPQPPWWQHTWFGLVLAMTGSACGIGSKEHAVVLPALAVLSVVVDRPFRSLLDAKVLAAIAATAVPIAIYLAVRMVLLGTLQGAYGSFGGLWGQAHLVSNVWSYVRAFTWVPMRPALMPGATSFADVLRYSCLALALPIVLLALLRDQRRLAAVCTLAFLVSVLPVCWFGLSTPSTIGGRFLYLPAMWLVVAVACGAMRAVDSLSTRPGVPARLVAGALLALVLAYTSTSLLYQLDLWQLACRLSQATFAELEPYRGRRDIALEIDNMPHISDEGPYVLKAYAFHFYRDGQSPLPPIKANAARVRLAWNGQAVAPVGIDPSSDYLGLPPNGLPERSIRLTLSPVGR